MPGLPKGLGLRSNSVAEVFTPKETVNFPMRLQSGMDWLRIHPSL